MVPRTSAKRSCCACPHPRPLRDGGAARVSYGVIFARPRQTATFRQHKPRDRCGLRDFCTRAARRPLRRPGPDLPRPGVSSWPRAMRAFCGLWGAQFVEVGGLMSYGTSLPEMYHQVGVRAKPADFAGDLVNQVRTGHQRPDRPHAQPHCSSGRARHCRRGDRMTAYGTELPIRNVRSSVANRA